MAGVPIARTLAGLPFTISAVSRPLDPGRTADLVIHPVMPRVSGSSPYGMVRCLDAGIEAAQSALPAIRALLAGESPVLVEAEHAPVPRIATDTRLAT